MKSLARDALVKSIKRKYKDIGGSFDEKQLRVWAAIEAREIGRGGVTYVHEAIGLSRSVIYAGLKEIGQPKKKDVDEVQKIRRRKRSFNTKPT